MAERKIEVNEDKINETQIVVNVKTLIIILGFVLTGLGTALGIINSNINKVQKSVDDLEIVKVTPLEGSYHDLDKKVYYLLMRTNSKQVDGTGGNAPPTSGPPSAP